mgnify:CR=1 FL=1
MEPTPAELKGMHTIEPVVAFVPMDAALAATFYAELGLEPGAPLRSLAAIDKDDLLEARSNMKLGGVALNAAAKGKVVTAWRVSRVALGVEKSTEVQVGDAELTRKLNEKKLEVLAIQAQAAATTATRPDGASTDCTVGQVNLAEVLDQTLTGSIPMLSDEEIQKCHNRFTAITEGKCPKEQKPTDQQLTALMFLLLKVLNLYADFAIFGPHGNRLRRKLMLSGLVPAGDGTYKRVELRGPPDIATWAAAFLVLRAALLMIGAASMAALDKYYDRVIRLAREYGSEVWMLLYQCDVRMRLEEMPSMRRDILEEVEDIHKAEEFIRTTHHVHGIWSGSGRRTRSPTSFGAMSLKSRPRRSSSRSRRRTT